MSDLSDSDREALKAYAAAYRDFNGVGWMFAVLVFPIVALYLAGWVAGILRFVVPGGVQ